MKYQLKTFNRNIPDQDLLDDLKRVAENSGITKLTSREYDNSEGKYASVTIGARFGSWNSALEKAGLGLVQYREVSEKELFKNMKEVWSNLGKQPVFRDMKSPVSKYSVYQYVAKFGTWTKALEAFAEYINSGH